MRSFRQFLAEAADRDAMLAQLAQPRGRLYRVDDWGSTKFILPDGTRLGSHADTHVEALADLDLDLYEVLALGVIRFTRGTGIETGGPITDAQAQSVIAAFHSSGTPVFVDVFNGKRRFSKQFEHHVTADAVRFWVNAHFTVHEARQHGLLAEARSSYAQAFIQHYGTTTNPHETKWLLPDGTRIKGDFFGDIHVVMAARVTGLRETGAALAVMRDGIIRYIFTDTGDGGIYCAAPLTEAQAAVIADDFTAMPRAPGDEPVMFVDVHDGTTFHHQRFSGRRITADAIRHWVGQQLAEAVEMQGFATFLEARRLPPSVAGMRAAFPTVARLQRYSNTFILPDGTILAVKNIDHDEAVRRLGWTLSEVLALGIVRQRGDAVHTRGRMTEAQATLIADYYNTEGYATLFVDGAKGVGKRFETPFTADALRQRHRRRRTRHTGHHLQSQGDPVHHARLTISSTTL